MHFIGGWLGNEQFPHWLNNLVAKYHCESELVYAGPWQMQETPDAVILTNGSSSFRLTPDLHFSNSKTPDRITLQHTGLAQIQRWAVRDAIGKKRLDLFLFYVTSHPDEPFLLPRPLRGYEKDFRLFNKQLLTKPDMTLAGYNSLIHGFHEGEKTDEKPEEIDNQLWNLVCDIEVRKATLGNINHIELLHQFRVSIRRTRSWLKQHPGEHPHLAKRLRKMIKTTNHSRDLDVFLNQSQQLIDWVNPRYQPALNELFELLAEQNRQQQQHLFKKLKNAPSLLDLLQPEADKASPPLKRKTTAPPLSLKPLLAQAIRLIDALNAQACDEAFHRCRISLKQLRYLLEMATQEQNNATNILLKQLKPIQDLLGEFNDRCVQQKELDSQCQTLSLSKKQTRAAKAMIHALHTHTQQQKPIMVNALRALKADLQVFKEQEMT